VTDERGGYQRRLVFGPFFVATEERVNWVGLVEDGSNSLVRALMMKVDAEGIGLVKFVYGVQVGGSGSTRGPYSAVSDVPKHRVERILSSMT
jgi:hypothetical protein